MKLVLALTASLLCSMWQDAPKPQDPPKEMDNPAYKKWKECKPGAYVKHKSTNDMGSMKIESTRTTKLVEIKDGHVWVEDQMTMNGREMPANKREVKEKITLEHIMPEGKFTKTGEGEEEIEVNGTKYKCQWWEGTFESEKMKSKGTSKSWYCADVIDGMVKSVMKVEMPGGRGTMTIESVLVEQKKE